VRPNFRKWMLTAVGVPAILFLFPALHATSITLTGNPNFGYQGILVGPYAATLGTDPNSLVFCLDLHIDTYVGVGYLGDVSSPHTQLEKEAAFLASYALYLGAPSGGLVDTVEGPISMAIWQLMETMGSTPPDPAAQPFIQLAQSAYSNDLITPDFLSGVSIWSPNPAGSSQRFVTAIRDDSMIRSAVPEPGTLVLLGIGVLLLVVSRALAIRRRTRI
jgi:hypothetical protein